MKTIVAIALLTLSVVAAPARAELPQQTRWADPSAVELEVNFPGNGYHATWDMFRCECGDLLIHSELTVPGASETGESMLVGGRVVLSRGFGDAEEALLGNSLDAPALMMQLALTLLERIAPSGPSASYDGAALSVEELLAPIYLDSGGAEGTFSAPWGVDGTISPVSPTQRRFDLTFRFSTGNPGEEWIGEMRLWGTAEFAPTEFPVPPESALSEWTFTWRDETDAAVPQSDGLTTLAELRAHLKAHR